jgi:NADH:ubiquinone oxidoreductase subunit F (NADH-binding)
VDYDSLKTLGTMMGSGGMIVMDETSNMVDVARYFMEFCMDESCGKCVPCRTGTQQMHGLLDKIAKAQGAATTWPCWRNSARWCRPPACAAGADRAESGQEYAAILQGRVRAEAGGR